MAMIPSTLTIWLALVTSSTQARPGSLNHRDDPGQTFSVNQIANPGYAGYVTTGQSVLVKAYMKFDKKMPAIVKNAAARVAAKFQDQGLIGGTGSVDAQPEAYDSEYLCSVAIGTPPQSLFLDFDTGSADLWVLSKETKMTQVNRQTLYEPAKSSTSQQLSGSTWHITSGDGSSSSGSVWLDAVNIGGVVVKHQAVESARQVSSSFTADSASSGFLGLGFSVFNRVKPNKQQTFFDNVKGLLKKGVMTVDLKAGDFGTYDFGYIDPKKKTGAVTYTPLNNTLGYWGIDTVGYAIGNGSVIQEDVPGIVDTGTSLLLLPDDVVENYYAAVNKSTYSVSEGGWIFDCDAIDPPPPPDFTVVINGHHATVPGKYINYAPSETRVGYCYGGLQSSAGIGINVYGDVFIKSQLVVFDSQQGRVGFANKQLA